MAVKASDNIKYYQNTGGPTITTVARPVIEADGLYFKDIDGSGTVSPVNDWRPSPAECAAAYVKLMTVDEKIGQLFISDWRMGPKYPSARLKGHVAVTRTLTEMFALGMFENTYRDAKKAKEVVTRSQYWADAELAHRQSVVLLKNDGTLPLRAEGKKVYVEAFKKDPKQGGLATAALREMAAQDATLVDDYNEADIAILFVNPSSGDYFTATAGYLELDICEGKEVPNVDGFCRPMAETHLETTLTGTHKIAEIAAAVHAKGGKVISNINFPLAWLVGNVERHVDCLLAGFETYPAATLDVIFGRFNPVGKLPITLARGDEVLAVNADGVCISPNDVPGYDKDPYMPAELKDENGKAYAYCDQNGNYYELNFGLRF